MTTLPEAKLDTLLTRHAADKYRSMSEVDTLSTLALLSKPKASSSGGSSALVSSSTPSRSRTALPYSARVLHRAALFQRHGFDRLA